MIRLIQKRLIIPRGDTGTFSVPVLAGKDSDDISIFTIFDPLTHKKILEKKIEPVDGMLHITFTHGDTVNLPIGQYVWDIKFYSDPVFVDEQLVDGVEVDSYYALFNLPVCEIRETGDNMLYGDDAPAATLAPDQIDLITRSLADIHTSTQTAVDSATAAEQSAASASDSAITAETSASSALDAAASALENKNAAAISAREAAESVARLLNALPTKISDLIDDSGHYTKPANGIPASDLEETYLTSFTETDPTVPSWAKEAQKPEYTAAEVGAMATDHPANDITSINITNWTKKTNLFDVSSDHNNVYDYWWSLTVPRDALWNINNAPGTSGKLKYLYVPSTNGSNLVKLELPTSNGKLALISDVPAWARATNKPTYTAQEVGALPADTVIPTVPTNVSAFTNDAGYITGYTETDPTVPTWAKASTKPSYTAAEVGAPTVAEMNSAISTAIGNINSFDIVVVQELPTQDINTHTIYLVPKTGETNDVYDEYIYINDAWEMIGNTQIDLSNYVQKDQIATSSVPGLVRPGNGTFVTTNGALQINAAPLSVIKTGNSEYAPITTSHQHESAFYGLAKAAGDTTQAQSNNAVGTYTDEAKTAIRTMLGVAASADIPTNVSAFTNDAGYLTQHQSLDNYVQKTDYATSDNYGLVKVGNGLRISSETGLLSTNPSFSEPEVKPGTNGTKPIVPGSQHYSTFYGLSKAAGVDLANETVTFGTYPETSKAAIRSMIGAAATSDVPDTSIYATKTDTILNTTLSRGRKASTKIGEASFAFGSNVEASAEYSHAEGYNAIASGPISHAEGNSTLATGYAAHTEGYNTAASGSNSHAEGYNAAATGGDAHAEGEGTIASGLDSHAEGYRTNAEGDYSHAEGYSTPGNEDYKPRSYNVSNDTITFTTVNQKPGAVGNSSHSEGSVTIANGHAAHAEGDHTYADGPQAHAEGSYTNATGDHAHSEGYNTTASGSNSHAEGSWTIATNLGSHAEGGDTVAYGTYSHAEGFEAKATAGYSHAEGYHTKASGDHSHAEGYRTAAKAQDAHAEGQYSEANGSYSHVEGLYGRVNNNGYAAHSEGYGSSTNRDYPQYNAAVDRTANFNGRTQPGTSINLPTGAHAQGAHNEGTYTTANSPSSHAEGDSTLAAAASSHAEGLGSIVTGGPASHAEGKYTYASGAGGAHAEGQYTIAQGGGGEHAEGMYTSASGGGGTHAEGFATSVSGSQGAHAEGYYVYGTGSYGFHIEGDHTECAVLNGAHTEGYYSKSFGRSGAHTEGCYTIGKGEGSHTGGRYNIPNSCNNLPDWGPNKLYHVGDKVKYLYPGRESPEAYTCKTEHTSGSEFNSINWTYEISDNGYAEIIGNGTADDARANARALDWEGNERLAGNLYVGCNPDSTGGTKVLTENDLEYTTEADALKIISDFWNEEEEDEGMLVTATYVIEPNGGDTYFETDKTATEIKQAFMSGKNVIVKLTGTGTAVLENDAYLQLITLEKGYSAPEGRNDYPYDYADNFIFGGAINYSISVTASHEFNNTFVSNGPTDTIQNIKENWVDATTDKLRFAVWVPD